MSLKSLISTLIDSTLSNEIVDRIKSSDRINIKGYSRTSKVVLCSALAQKSLRPLLIIVSTLEEASRWFELLQLMGWEKTYLYPNSDTSPYESLHTSTEIIWGQLAVLTELVFSNDQDCTAIVCTERSLYPHLISPNLLKDKCIFLKKGEEIDIDQLSDSLAKLGYERTNTSDQEGNWSRRGDIIDIFAVNNELPIRVELFGDVIDKIKEYNPINQRSLEELDELLISPTNLSSIHTKTSDDDYLNIRDIYSSLDKGDAIHPLKIINNEIESKSYSLLDFLHEETFVVIDDKEHCISHTNEWSKYLQLTYDEFINSSINNNIENNLSKPNIKDTDLIYHSLNRFKGINIYSDLNKNKPLDLLDLKSNTIQTYPNQISKLSELIKSYQNKQYSIWIISAQPSRICALLEEHDCEVKFIQNTNDLKSLHNLIQQKTPLSLKINGNTDIEGFNLIPWRILLITDKEFFGQQFVSSAGYIRKRNVAGSNIIRPNKLLSGDYVVHRNHGVGRFLKIEKLIINNEARDYLLVQYLDGTIRVAADQLGSLGKFRGNSQKPPRLNKLGGSTWKNAKEKARKSINKVAVNLIKLYAERSKLKGYSFPQDGPWQKELEDSFPYDPTPDQSKAVVDIKEDMQRNIPMDRLVCGDVGFGKTEVAVRALFKAITSGKQVAFLAPTTVLAQQHWRTLTDRFAPYPIKVSLLNRFKSAKERKNIIHELKEGKIDAIVGTHLLLSKSIQFKDIGLLVIDEEQRFGVTQKEKIKSLKKNIDVLTLSATPIPRTLYMSLSGVREMSLITTPPPLRRSIKTHLACLDDEIVRSAISQEIGRGGQIFYVVPRINGIEHVAEKLKAMVPNIRLIVAHGQMNEGELENAMIAFNAGEADLMLCTTIIESGLDIPRVNTILIEDSHKFGLSQLYQLRGRVGRSGIQAHAWLFYPKDIESTSNASNRLKAISEFSELGSGYQLAMRDMEIRGVGNLIGIEQSGQMDTIGFDLYMEILHEAISEIQGQTIPVVEQTKIDLPITAFIPSSWISDNDEKIAAYKSASECNEIDQLIDLSVGWIDRYGVLPSPVSSLILIMRLKIWAKKCGISRIKQVKPNIVFETLMNESTFKSLRKGLASNIHSRVVFKKGDHQSEILIRGLFALSLEKQVDTVIDWLEQMSTQIELIDDGISESIKSKIPL